MKQITGIPQGFVQNQTRLLVKSRLECTPKAICTLLGRNSKQYLDEVRTRINVMCLKYPELFVPVRDERSKLLAVVAATKDHAVEGAIAATKRHAHLSANQRVYSEAFSKVAEQLS